VAAARSLVEKAGAFGTVETTHEIQGESALD